MIVVMDQTSAPELAEDVAAALRAEDMQVLRSRCHGRAHLISTGTAPRGLAERIRPLPGVESVVDTEDALRFTGRAYQRADTVVDVAGVPIGGPAFVVVAGPCAVENRAQMGDSAHGVALAGGAILRGGAYKPRTSPYSFQGLGRAGLRLLAEQREVTGLPIITEVLDVADLDDVLEVADILQVGTRNMSNATLLRAIGRSGRPVLLKRGMAATIEEWLLAAEYILSEGNPDVVLCERGIRTFEPATRFTLDLSAVAAVRRISHLPVIVDPSHAAGRTDLVRPLALAAAAVGADGIMIDIHPDAATALCDAGQALHPKELAELTADLGRLLTATGRVLAVPPPRPMPARPRALATEGV
ncbi:3-deoxy-7-phosphoheptulonate synthase [Embleya scabrispora]|uniref:3-deoxy-7-phosphoheptulonate synthase n=2 Tax=Embleya scabrispora TaxID=159449 RepID=A0A1T3NSD6_9ACTN|nr:3-deoxy-7-phosphoheptulonate synthase [Embleya scabrispora]